MARDRLGLMATVLFTASLMPPTWAQEATSPGEAGPGTAASELPRPPAIPPHAEDPRYVDDVIEQYHALARSRPLSLERARAQPRASWYHQWKQVHDAAKLTRNTIAHVEQELAHLRDLGAIDEAAVTQAELDRLREGLAASEDAWAHGRVGSLLVTSDPELDLIPERPAGFSPGPANLGFYAERGITSDPQRTRERLAGTQYWAIRTYEMAPPPEQEEFKAYSRELGHCLGLLDAGRVDELERIFEDRWRWIMAWGDDSGFEQVGWDALPPLLVAAPTSPITGPAIKAIKKRMKKQPLIERNRIELQAKFASALLSSHQNFQAGDITFDELHGTFAGAFGVGWADVRTGGDRVRVMDDLGRIEHRLSTWLERTKQDSPSSCEAATRLLERVIEARRQYEDAEYAAVMEHLAAIRAWILEGSGFELD